MAAYLVLTSYRSYFKSPPQNIHPLLHNRLRCRFRFSIVIIVRPSLRRPEYPCSDQCEYDKDAHVLFPRIDFSYVGCNRLGRVRFWFQLMGIELCCPMLRFRVAFFLSGNSILPILCCVHQIIKNGKAYQEGGNHRKVWNPIWFYAPKVGQKD